MTDSLPERSDFPQGTEFLILEWDVPLAKEPRPDGLSVSYFNWYGGYPRSYPAERLKPGNNWPADSFEQWLEIIRNSL